MKHGYSWTLLQLLKFLTHVSFGSKFRTFSATKTIADIACVPSVPHGRPIPQDEGLCSVIPAWLRDPSQWCARYVAHSPRIASERLDLSHCSSCRPSSDSTRGTVGDQAYSVRQGAQFRSPFCVVPAPWRPWANTSHLFLYDGATQTLPIPLLASDLQQHADHFITHALHFIAVEASENVNHKDKIMHHLVTNCN